MAGGDEIRIEAPGLMLAGLAWGQGSGTPVVCLHGWLDNAESFRPLAERLAGGHRIIALDLPGHGLSEHFGPGWAGHFVDAIPAVLQALRELGGGGPVDVVGHSMGAGIATVLAGTFPEAVRRLVLIEGFGPMAEAADRTPVRLAKSLAAEAQARPVETRTWPSFEAAVTARMRGLTRLDLPAARRLVQRGAEAVDGGYRFRHDPRLRLPSRVRFTEDQVRAFLARIAAPVLAVRAAGGWPFPDDTVRERSAAIARLEVVTVPGGHHVHLDHPERVAPLVDAFLTGE